MKNLLKTIGGFALAFAGFAAAAVVVFLLVNGGAWLADKVYPILIVLFILALVLTVLVLLPLAIFGKTRGFAGVAIYVTSYVYGLTVWIWSLLLTYTLWGGFAVVIGILLGGVGIVPLSVVACLLNGLFSIGFQVVLLAAFVFGVRMFALFLIASAERYQETQSQDCGEEPKSEREFVTIPVSTAAQPMPLLPPSFVFSCPHCGQHISATRDQIGTSGGCAGCQKTVVVPDGAG